MPTKRKSRRRRKGDRSSVQYDVTTDSRGRKKRSLWSNSIYGFS